MTAQFQCRSAPDLAISGYRPNVSLILTWDIERTLTSMSANGIYYSSASYVVRNSASDWDYFCASKELPVFHEENIG